MLFAKELNYLATRMAVLSRASALVDALINVTSQTLNTMDEPKIKTNFETYFDDTGFEWSVPCSDIVCEKGKAAANNEENYYQTGVSLDVSEEQPSLEPIENSLNTCVKIFFDLTTDIIKPDGTSFIRSTDPSMHNIDLVIIVDKSGAHIDEAHSSITITEEYYKDSVKGEPEVDRDQMESFFKETLKAIDMVNGDKFYKSKYDDVTFKGDIHYNLENINEEDDDDDFINSSEE